MHVSDENARDQRTQGRQDTNDEKLLRRYDPGDQNTQTGRENQLQRHSESVARIVRPKRGEQRHDRNGHRQQNLGSPDLPERLECPANDDIHPWND